MDDNRRFSGIVVKNLENVFAASEKYGDASDILSDLDDYEYDHFRDWGHSFPNASGTKNWINQQPFHQNAGAGMAIPEQFESQVSTGEDSWSITLNMRFFAPEEIKIKTVGAAIEVSAQHEQHDREGTVSRDFFRKYHLPLGVDPQSVKCDLTAEGLLIISAPLP